MVNDNTPELKRYVLKNNKVYDTEEQEYLTPPEICQILNNIEEDEGKSYR